MTFWYPEKSQAETEEFFTNNGHPLFAGVNMKPFKVEALADLI